MWRKVIHYNKTLPNFVGNIGQGKEIGCFGGCYPYFIVPFRVDGKQSTKKFYYVLGDEKDEADKRQKAISFKAKKESELGLL